MPILQGEAEELGRKYTEAWCSHDPEALASWSNDVDEHTNDGQLGRPASLSAVINRSSIAGFLYGCLLA
jgi:hypothetical protein